MTSEPENSPSPPDESPLPADPKEEPGKRAAKSKTRPVFIYVSLMFAAAILLLLLSFFMQERNHQAIMNGLSSSQINAQSVVELELQNSKLEEQIQELEKQLSHSHADNTTLQANLEAAQKSRQAMDWLLAVQEKYDAKRYEEARKLMLEFQATQLPNALPTTSALSEAAPDAHPEGSTLSPAARFAELQKLLG